MSTQTASLWQHAGLFQRLWERWTTAGRPRASDAGRDATDEAASVRALADSYQRSDPSFASDLYAAADRHERAAGVGSAP